LKTNISQAINAFNREGFVTIGIPSPIVTVLIGPEDLARLMARDMTDKKVLANMAEFPAVPKGKSIFRFQIMSTHRAEQINEAERTLVTSRADALAVLNSLK
jgi:glycine C-acetyltransferase